MLKTRHSFKSEGHNVFTEEINKMTLSSNDDKKIQSINSIETYIYIYGTSKDFICKKEKLKQLRIIKAVPKCLSFIMSQMKTYKKIIQNGQKLLTIRMEY